MLLDPAAPWPTDGIVYWLGLVIADHIPASPDNVLLEPFLIVSASLVLLIVLALISPLLCQPFFRNQTMDSSEITLSCKPLCDGAVDACPPYDDCTMDVDVETEGQAFGLPFPGTLLADGTFAVEYHNM